MKNTEKSKYEMFLENEGYKKIEWDAERYIDNTDCENIQVKGIEFKTEIWIDTKNNNEIIEVLDLVNSYYAK